MMELRRRGFLCTLLLGLAALVGGAPGRWLAARAEPAQPAETGAAEGPLLSPASRRRLAEFADVIVPEWNGHPAAGTDEFVVRFEALARATPDRVDGYRRFFERFARAVDARVPPLPGPPDPLALAALFEAWHHEWRTEAKPSFAAQFFEMLRRDVLRTYYASPAGWKAAGYGGPAHRATPDAAPHA
jgi:hypothetical protein